MFTEVGAEVINSLVKTIGRVRAEKRKAIKG
jgi:hypothetical protein